MSGVDLFVIGGIIICCLGVPVLGVPLIVIGVIAGWTELSIYGPKV